MNGQNSEGNYYAIYSYDIQRNTFKVKKKDDYNYNTNTFSVGKGITQIPHTTARELRLLHPSDER